MWLSGLCLAWSSKTLGSFPSTEKNKTNHNLKKEVSNGRWPRKGHRDTGAARSPCGAPSLSGQREPPRQLPPPFVTPGPQGTCLDLTPRRRRPLVLSRGGAAHRNRFSARPVPQAGGGVLGGQAGRLGAGPQGARPGGDSRPKHQGPGASGAPRTAPSLSSLKPEH